MTPRAVPDTIARLKRQVAVRDARIAKLTATVVRQRADRARAIGELRRVRRMSPREFRALFTDRCPECGAEEGERCTNARGCRVQVTHHLRGRSAACGPNCTTCREWFV